MSKDRVHHCRAIVAGISVCMALLATGCGSNTVTQPQAVVKVMGGILESSAAPVGSQLQAGVVVTVDGQLVTNATVSINSTPLMYVNNQVTPSQTGYVGLINASPGDVLTLTAVAAGQTIVLTATVPGRVKIHTLAGGLSYPRGTDIPISWDAASNSLMNVVTCAAASSMSLGGMWLLSPTTTQYTVPASAATVPGDRISVMAANGSGDMPTSMDMRQWTAKNGFWITSQDYVDVQITE